MAEERLNLKFTYRRDRRCRRITAFMSVGLAGLFAALLYLMGETYLPVWVILFVLALLALEILSIPRYISLDDDALEIHCVVELTRIHVEDIETIHRIERKDFRHFKPLFGSYGFWGYYGYYFNFSEWSFYKLYATERQSLVLIRDIYEENYVVSCSDPEALVTAATRARDRKREEIFNASRRKKLPFARID